MPSTCRWVVVALLPVVASLQADSSVCAFRDRDEFVQQYAVKTCNYPKVWEHSMTSANFRLALPSFRVACASFTPSGNDETRSQASRAAPALKQSMWVAGVSVYSDNNSRSMA